MKKYVLSFFFLILTIPQFSTALEMAGQLPVAYAIGRVLSFGYPEGFIFPDSVGHADKTRAISAGFFNAALLKLWNTARGNDLPEDKMLPFDLGFIHFNCREKYVKSFVLGFCAQMGNCYTESRYLRFSPNESLLRQVFLPKRR